MVSEVASRERTLVPFRTARLRCEPPTPQHAEALVAALADPRIYRYLPDDPPSLAQMRERLTVWQTGRSPSGSQLWLNWLLVPHDLGKVIGLVQATVEGEGFRIAYLLHPDHWRVGYGREAVSAMLDHLFEHLPVETATAELDTRNAGSRALVERLGFRRIRTVPHADEFKGSISDEFVYELGRAAWTTEQQC